VNSRTTVTVQSQLWSRNGFILLSCRRLKNHFCQEVRIRHVRSLKKCFTFYLMLIATSPTVHSEIIQLQREESPAKSDESRKMLFIL